MPVRSARPCSYPGCGSLTRGSRCEKHQHVREADNRASAAARGYDRQWRKLRLWFLRCNPVCVMCHRAAEEVDHITPIRDGGTNDPDNLRALCKSCHSKVTARYRAGKKTLSGADLQGNPLDTNHFWNQ
jgi:5-methylcytosine-specific restriction enzyme A